MPYDLRIRKARIIGRSHLIEGVNMQDAMSLDSVEVRGRKYIFGVICDGCSMSAEGTPLHSEVGANLGVEFLSGDIRGLLKSRVPLRKIPNLLHRRTVEFLRRQVSLLPYAGDPESQVRFIVDKLLFTVIGFIYSDEETIVFYQGDGVFIVNEVVTVLDQNDLPAYIGYSAINRNLLLPEASSPPDGFETLVIPSGSITRLAIASDSLGKEPEFFTELWGYKMPIGLQRKVNVWSLNDHKFQDDLSIITLEKFPIVLETQS